MAADRDTLWEGTLFITLGAGGEDLIPLRVSFLEDANYEPPQGTIAVDECPQVVAGARARWQLSEDPEDRKDGLWVWGLFKEPLYPFILFEIDCEVGCRTPAGDELGPGTYVFRGSHAREGGRSVLSQGDVLRRVPVAVPLPGQEDYTYAEPVKVGTYVARRAT